MFPSSDQKVTGSSPVRRAIPLDSVGQYVSSTRLRPFDFAPAFVQELRRGMQSYGLAREPHHLLITHIKALSVFAARPAEGGAASLKTRETSSQRYEVVLQVCGPEHFAPAPGRTFALEDRSWKLRAH